jgi:DnaJ family protein C protein 7
MIADEQHSAEEWKEKGNLLFKSSNFQEAAQLYSKAIELQPDSPTFYSNRAAAYLNDAKYKLALQDCLSALKLDANLVKAFFRAAKCQCHLGNLEDAKTQLLNLNAALERSEQSAKAKQVHLVAISNEMAAVKLLQQMVLLEKTPSTSIPLVRSINSIFYFAL